jgi:hypothetical protein
MTFLCGAKSAAQLSEIARKAALALNPKQGQAGDRGSAKRSRAGSRGAPASSGVRRQQALLQAIDAWRDKQWGRPSRSEPIRRLV